MNHYPLIFLHGLGSSSQGVKSVMLRKKLSGIVIPDFHGPLQRRMEHLGAILSSSTGWILIGSSFGGLMAALYARQFPDEIRKLILLAPALVWPEFLWDTTVPISTLTIVYHGVRDNVIPFEKVFNISRASFMNLEFHKVDDDHGLYKTAQNIDWLTLIHGG